MSTSATENLAGLAAEHDDSPATKPEDGAIILKNSARGMVATPATPETDRDPRNPNR